MVAATLSAPLGRATRYPATSDPAVPIVRRFGRIATAIFMVIVVVAVFGARLSDGSTIQGFLRSVQVIDLILPAMFLVVAAQLATTSWLVGKDTFNVAALFLLSAALSAVVGHFVAGGRPDAAILTISMLFLVKEIEFLLVLGIAALFTYRNPDSAMRVLTAACVFLALWAIKEFFFPSGFYYMGLPFEAGPSQTGAVYALFAFMWCVLATIRWPTASAAFRRVYAPLILMLLVLGNLGSLSRTGQAGLVAGLGVLLVTRARSRLVVLLMLPVMYLVYVMAFTDSRSLLDVGFTNRWTGAVDNFPDRVIKWVAMFDFQRDHPWTFLTGAGFNSPNRYVLDRFSPVIELGNVLAVDNGYVRRLFEVGIIGTGLYFMFLFRLAWNAWSTRFGSIAAGGVVSMLTIAIAIESFQVTQTAVAFFLFMGCVLGFAKGEAVRSAHRTAAV